MFWSLADLASFTFKLAAASFVAKLCVYFSFQSIKLLGVEKGKKGKINLVFVAGQRVLDYLGQCYNREKLFTAYLK